MSPIHFISGLPRSGSTLLAAILRQNPRFRAGMMSPVAALVSALVDEMSQKNGFSCFINDAQRKRILKGLFWAYYEDLSFSEHADTVVFDTHRSWCGRMAMLGELFPDAKVIACVRSPAWVMDSLERQGRRHPLQPSGMAWWDGGTTLNERAIRWNEPDGLMGYAFNGLKQACYAETAGKLMLLQFDTLTRFPDEAMHAVYGFLEEDEITHDFTALAYEADEFDARLGSPGLHRVRPKIESVERESILPPDMFSRLDAESFWLSNTFKSNARLV